MQKLRLRDCNVKARDHISNGSFLDIETPTSSTMGLKTRLKDCSNALTTSKELLKIINRMWNQQDRPSSSISLFSALHSELERARLQVNHLIHQHKPENTDICYLMNRFAEEKAVWKRNEQELVKAAIESVDVERKLRKRFENLNKKLGKELAETKSDLMKAVREIEKEKQLRVMVEELKRESFKIKKERNKDKDEIEDSDESDLHSIELNIIDNKNYKWPSTQRKSLALQRSISDCVDWVVQSKKLHKNGDRGLDWGKINY